ncbi:hypothetical protein C0J52_27701, partial [Blattella germanica]
HIKVLVYQTPVHNPETLVATIVVTSELLHKTYLGYLSRCAKALFDGAILVFNMAVVCLNIVHNLITLNPVRK